MRRSGEQHLRRAAFTLMEMMVSISILLLVILGVGMIFRSMSRAVGMSQAALEMFSNVRAFGHQLETDLHAMDRQSFLVIRGRVAGGRRYDQMCFLGYGNYANRTGSQGDNAFASQLRSGAAVIWYGHAMVLAGTAPGGSQDAAVPLDAVPAGNSDADFWLCRHTRLLLPANSPNDTVTISGDYPSAAYPSAFWTSPLVAATPMEPPAHVSASRISAVRLTPMELMAQVAAGRQHQPRFEADNLCFRFKVLPNVYASEVQDANGRPSLVNAAFRMHPVLLQGASEFAVEWTDGGTNAGGALLWYGVGAPRYASPHQPGDEINEPALANGDNYTAIFTGAPCLAWTKTDTYQAGEFVTSGGSTYRSLRGNTNRDPAGGTGDWIAVDAPIWPVAMRITYRVTDANDRLEGGRQLVQIVSLKP